MKGRFWRKMLAVILSLLIVSGSIPAQPLSELFGGAVTAYAAGEEMLVGDGEAGVLELGENEVTVTESGDWTRYIFTPEDDGYYGFISEEKYEGEGDPVAALYYGGNELASNDDFADNGESGLLVYLESGRNYTFMIREYTEFEATFMVRIRYIPTQDLVEGENDVAVWLGQWIEHTFTPTENGVYRFYSSGESEPGAELRDASGNQIAYDNNNRNFSFTAELEADQEYTFKILENDTSFYDAETVRVYIEKTAIYDVTVDENTEYGYVQASATQAFAGDIVTVEAYPDSDYYLSDWVVTSDEDYSTIEVKDNDDDGYEDFVMPDANVTVSAVFAEKPTSLDVGENILPTLKGEWAYYSFTPAETGKYIFAIHSTNSSYNWSLQNALYYRYDTEEELVEAILTEGSECVFGIQNVYEEERIFSIDVSYESLPSAQIGENEAETIYWYDYYSGEEDCSAFYMFTPQEDGRYCFYSACEEDVADPGAELYDGNNSYAYNAGSGDDSNFKFTIELEGGKSYILRITNNYFEDSSFPFFIEKAAHAITVDNNLAHGIIEASANQAEEGEYITLTVAPDDGYIVSEWNVKDEDGNNIELSGNEFVMPNSAVTVSATFAEPILHVGDNPIVSLGDDAMEFTFTPTATANYTFSWENPDISTVGIYDGDEELGFGSGNSSFSTILEAGKEYEIELWTYGATNFVLEITAAGYSVIVDDGVENGTVAASVELADEGEWVTLTATPEDGYYLSKWIVKDETGEEIQVENSNTFCMPDSSVTVSAAFVEPILQLGTNPVVALGDDMMEYVFTPDATCYYQIYSEDGDDNLGGAELYEGDNLVVSYNGNYNFYLGATLYAGTTYYLDIWPNGVTSFTVVVETPAHAVSVDGNTEHGTIEASVDLANQDDTVTLVASPEEGYRLAQWIVTDGAGNAIDVVDDEFYMPADNVTVAALFAQPTVALGNNHVMTQNDVEWAEYSFTPSDSGRYRFFSVSNEEIPEGALFAGDKELAYNSGNGREGYSFEFEVLLTGGVEYTFAVREYYGRAIHFTVCIEAVELPLLDVGENSVTTKTRDWVEYGFYPMESCKYRFYSVGGRYNPTAELYGEEGYINGGDDDEGNDFRFSTSLTAGKFYVLKVKEANGRKVTFTVGIEVADRSVTVDDSLEHGSIEASAEMAEEGETVTLTASPDNGYYLHHWIVTDEDGEAVAVQGDEFVMPDKNVTVSAEFISKPASINVGENELPSLANRELKYSFTADDSGIYSFYSVGDDYGDPFASLYNGNEYIAEDDNSGEGNHFSFSAYLEAGHKYVFRISSRYAHCYTVMVEAPMYTIVVDEEIVNGQVVASALEAAKGETVSLEITPDEGFAIKSVSVNGDEIEPGEDGYVFDMPGEDAFVTAEFEDTRNILSTVNITLGGELGLNFYMIIPDAVVNGGAKILMDGPEGEKEFVLSELVKDAKGRYSVTYKIKAVYMDQNVTLKLVDSEKTLLPLLTSTGDIIENNTVEYSIYDYVYKARTVSTITDDELSVINAMYTYGAYSVKWKYSTPVPEDVDELPDITLSEFRQYRLMQDGASDTITLTGGSLILDSNTKFRLYFKSSDDIGNHTIKLGDIDLTPHATKTKGKYYVDIENIGAGNLKSDYEIVFDGSYSATVSAMTYIYNFLMSDMDDENLENLLKALYAYSDAVDYAL